VGGIGGLVLENMIFDYDYSFIVMRIMLLLVLMMRISMLLFGCL
jgi:hypothetical protein